MFFLLILTQYQTSFQYILIIVELLIQFKQNLYLGFGIIQILRCYVPYQNLLDTNYLHQTKKELKLMTIQQILDANPFETRNMYNVPSPYYYNNQPMNDITFNSPKYNVRANVSNTGLICGIAATAVGIGLGYCLYKKFCN